MTKWQRFGESTWVNVDHVEVVRVDEQEEGGWQLTAVFASGRTHPLGCHADRDLLVECTDAVLRDQVGEHLLTLVATEQPAAAGSADPEPAPAAPRRWRFWRSGRALSASADAHPAPEPLPAG